MSVQAFKLLRVRKDGTLGSLFMDARARLPIGVWLTAENHQKKGYELRPGWHCMPVPNAPHLTMKGRAWFPVEIEDYQLHIKPKSQGGRWYVAQQLRILG